MVRERVRELTGLLRTSDEPLWARLRVLLREKGIDPANSLLFQLFTDDCEFEFGLVVTRDRRVFQFGFDYLHRALSEGTFTEWVEWTRHSAGLPYRKRAAAALRLLEDR